MRQFFSGFAMCCTGAEMGSANGNMLCYALLPLVEPISAPVQHIANPEMKIYLQKSTQCVVIVYSIILLVKSRR